MGKALTKVRKPLRNFNIEDRAHKAISREKPIAAPKYPSDVAAYEKILKDHPEVIEESLKKHETLNQHLKNVFVTSHDPSPRIVSNPSGDRPLPEDRGVVQDFEFGFKEVDKVPVGKASLRTVMSFIGMYQNNPKHNTPEKIAAEYDLDVDKVSKILKYVKAYEVYIPETNKRTKARFAGPSFPRTTARKIPRPQLPVGKKDASGGGDDSPT